MEALQYPQTDEKSLVIWQKPLPPEVGSLKQGPVPKNLLVVHVDANVLANPQSGGRSYIEDVGSVPAETSRRLGCDAQVVEVVEDRADALVTRNRTKGLDITPETNRITWAGQPVEYGWAVDVLMPGRGPTFGTA